MAVNQQMSESAVVLKLALLIDRLPGAAGIASCGRTRSSVDAVQMEAPVSVRRLLRGA
jgi:hypothetical protein